MIPETHIDLDLTLRGKKTDDKVEVSDNFRAVPGEQEWGFNTKEGAAQRTAKKEYCRHLLATVGIASCF